MSRARMLPVGTTSDWRRRRRRSPEELRRPTASIAGGPEAGRADAFPAGVRKLVPGGVAERPAPPAGCRVMSGSMGTRRPEHAGQRPREPGAIEPFVGQAQRIAAGGRRNLAATPVPQPGDDGAPPSARCAGWAAGECHRRGCARAPRGREPGRRGVAPFWCVDESDETPSSHILRSRNASAACAPVRSGTVRRFRTSWYNRTDE